MTKKLLLPADINTRANNSSIDQAVILSARPIFNSLLGQGLPHHLEQFPIRRNRRGFSNRHRSDSSCVLAKEAGMHGPSAFPGSSSPCGGSNRGRDDPPPSGTAVRHKPLERDPLGSAVGKLGRPAPAKAGR